MFNGVRGAALCTLLISRGSINAIKSDDHYLVGISLCQMCMYLKSLKYSENATVAWLKYIILKASGVSKITCTCVVDLVN